MFQHPFSSCGKSIKQQVESPLRRGLGTCREGFVTVWAGGVQRGGGAGDVEIMTSGPALGVALRR